MAQNVVLFDVKSAVFQYLVNALSVFLVFVYILCYNMVVFCTRPRPNLSEDSYPARVLNVFGRTSRQKLLKPLFEDLEALKALYYL